VLFASLALLGLPAAAQAAPPVGCFTVSPSSPLTNETTTLNSSCSTDDRGITSRAWDLDNDGQFDDGTATSVTKTWPAAGTYTVRLRVADAGGENDIESKTVTVRNRAPIVTFTISPTSAPTGTVVNFTSTSADPDGTITLYEWDTDGDAIADYDGDKRANAARPFSTPGTYPIRLRVTDNNGAQSTLTKSVTITNRLPTASFTVAAATSLSKQAITFISTSKHADGSIASQAWDTDGDAAVDFNDGTGTTATKTWDTPGSRVVRLRVTDNNGGQSITTVTVNVGDRPPVASFTVAPETIVEGDTVTLTSTATDEDGTIAGQAWDLNNDGAYDDGTDATASFIPAAPGAYSVGLRVVDNQNVARAVTQTITVGARPASPSGEQTFDVSTPTTPTPAETPPVNPVAPLRFLDPFPVIRLRGRTTGKGARLSSFTVRAPHGSSVSVRCSGRSCPVKKWNKTVKTKRKRGSGTLHVRKLERFLPKGLQVEVRVSNKDMVGKYTRIKIRGLAVPIRADRCLLPGSSKPSACPSVP